MNLRSFSANSIFSGSTLLAIIALTAIATSFNASIANADDVGYEIPYEQSDRRVAMPTTMPHHTYYTKAVTCQNKEMAILYLKISGYSNGSKFIGTCQQVFAHSKDACVLDNSKIARQCYNSAITYFKLEDKYPKINAEPVNIDAPPTAAPQAIGRPVAL